MRQQLQIGDRVKYAARFLRSIGVHTGEMCFAVGVITDLVHTGGTTLAVVDWVGGKRLPSRINADNLVDASRMHLERVD